MPSKAILISQPSDRQAEYGTC